MNIETWVEENIKPNVLAVTGIRNVATEQGVVTYDISVVVTTNDEGLTNKVTQSVYAINDGAENVTYHFARRVIKNFEPPNQPKLIEEKLQDALTAIKLQDPSVKFVELIPGKNLEIIKLQINNEVKALTFLGDELIQMDVM